MSPQRANLMEPVGRHIAGVEAILRADWPVGEAIASLRGKPLKGAIYEQAVVKSVRDGRW